MERSSRKHWAIRYIESWSFLNADPWVLDLDFDTMFSGPIDVFFQEEPYQNTRHKTEEVRIRKVVVKNPPLGKHSVWPEARRTEWRT
jgi:hypothetical protein